MKNKNLKLLTILLIILFIEIIAFFILTHYQTNHLKNEFALKIEVEKLNQEKKRISFWTSLIKINIWLVVRTPMKGFITINKAI
jgi:hypothetical protein